MDAGLRFDEHGMLIRGTSATIGTPGSVAFKCTYNDKAYRHVCSDEAYRHNVAAGRVWCKDEDNDCRNYVCKELTLQNLPCYECGLFRFWRYGGGVKRGPARSGETVPLKAAEKGGMAFLTTREPHHDEVDRYIFGFLFIKDKKRERDQPDNENIVMESVFVIGDKERSLEFDPRAYLKFWEFYRNPKNPSSIFWGTGLYRSLDDDIVLKVLLALQERYSSIDDDKAKEIINAHVSRYERVV